MELKKGETIMTDAALHLPAAFLHSAFSNRSGVPLEHFELYYRGKRLEGEATLASLGVGKDSTIEVKMRGRGGTKEGKQPQIPAEKAPSRSVDHVEKKVWDAQKAGVEEINATKGAGASAVAVSSAEQHLAGKEDCSMEAPEAVLEKAAVEVASVATKEAVAEKDVTEKDPIVATVGADKAGAGDAVSPPAQDMAVKVAKTTDAIQDLQAENKQLKEMVESLRQAQNEAASKHSAALSAETEAVKAVVRSEMEAELQRAKAEVVAAAVQQALVAAANAATEADPAVISGSGVGGAKAGKAAGQGIGSRMLAGANGLWGMLRNSEVEADDELPDEVRNTDTAQRAAPAPGTLASRTLWSP